MNTKLQVLEGLETMKIGRISLFYSGFWVTENIVGLIREYTVHTRLLHLVEYASAFQIVLFNAVA